tara:strand:+ start:321 stop:1208 length:888 start_codon:yes stop_codon:yes gene_type:complete
MNKYPVYIVSKGRWENPMTAKFFLKDGVKFKIVVEPQEYDNYCKALGKEYVLKLPFSNLGLGSYPARNYAWEDSIKNGYERHWLFDDNIQKIRRVYKGNKIPCNSLKAIQVLEEFTDRYENIGITGFNYSTFVVPGCSDKKPFYLNVHAYSAMLMKNNMPYRWRLKYNEDVDLCLQVLDNKLCTILFNAFTVDKTSTVAKMKGGNQDELYKGNAYEKKILKARSLEEIWPQYAETRIRFNRPHHYVNWKKHFNHNLVRRKDIDWDKIVSKKHNIKLKKVNDIKSESLKTFYKENK